MSSDDFWNKPHDLRSLPTHIREQIRANTPLREGETHVILARHKVKNVGTVLPNARLWVEPLFENRSPHRRGIILSHFDQTGTTLLSSTQLFNERAETFLLATLRTYVNQGGSLDKIANLIDELREQNNEHNT